MLVLIPATGAKLAERTMEEEESGQMVMLVESYKISGMLVMDGRATVEPIKM